MSQVATNAVGKKKARGLKADHKHLTSTAVKSKVLNSA